MQKTKIYVIINPISGVGSKKNIPEKLYSRFDQRNTDLRFFVTGYAGHAREIAEIAVREEAGCVVAVGGDGTVNEVAGALTESKTALAIIPCGSGNGLARDLHIPLNADKAVEVVVKNHQAVIDYGTANGRKFFCTCGIGFDAAVSHNFAQGKTRGPLMYAKSMITAYAKFVPEDFEIIYPEGRLKEKAFLVTCANATQYGNNAYIAPNADMQDGLMNIAVLKPFGRHRIPQTAMQLFSKKIGNNKSIREIITSEVTLKRSQPGWMHIDGDPVYEGEEIRVKIIPKGLTVIVPIR